MALLPGASSSPGISSSRRLGLANAPDAHNKHVVFVKLTDSSLEALTKYIKHANKNTLSSTSTSIQKPTIAFSHNSGTFTVPIVGEDGSKQQQKFTFGLSSIDEQNGPQGSFECLESRRQGLLESLGPIQDKVHVQASDKSFIKFEKNMANVKKENEKRTTRYLDQNNGLVNSSNKIVSRKHTIASKPISNGQSRDLYRYSHTHGHGSGHRGQPQQGQPQPPLLPGSHPMLDRSKHKNKHNPEIMKRTLRERIVHLLAVRPYKKPELLERMHRDGLRDKEKKELFQEVKRLSMMKDNTYHLQRHIWNDVSEDWPFYSEEERQAFRRRKPQNLTPPGSDGSTGSVASGHSSSSSHPASPQPSLKRAAPSYLDSSPEQIAGMASAGPGSSTMVAQAKKKRVSNFVRPPGSSLSPLSVGRDSPQDRSPTSDMLVTAVESSENKTNAWLKTNQELMSINDSHSSQRSSLSATTAAGTSPTPMPPVPLSSSSTASSTTGLKINPDFMTKFVRIGNGEQRRAYKGEFNRDYNRYMVLHGQLNRVSQKFSKLQRQLRHTPDTSPEYQRLKAQIVQEYRTTIAGGQYKKDQEDFQYLHDKLAHIKKLVHDYDTKYLSSMSSSSSSSHNRSQLALASS